MLRLRLRLGTGALQQVVEIERTVSGDDDHDAEAPPDQAVDNGAHPGMNQLWLERERERKIQAAGGKIDGRQHDPACELGRPQTQAVGLERVDSEGEMLAVELERADRNEGERREFDRAPKLGRVKTLVAVLAHPGRPVIARSGNAEPRLRPQ